MTLLDQGGNKGITPLINNLPAIARAVLTPHAHVHVRWINKEALYAAPPEALIIFVRSAERACRASRPGR